MSDSHPELTDPGSILPSLWAPWRVEYFQREKPERDFLLAAAQATDDAAHLVVRRRRNGFLVMNRYPYAAGHLMAVPYRQVGDTAALSEAEKLDLFALAEEAQAVLRATIRAQGFNVGFNIGACAGAGVTDHLHLHIVPRWPADVNFMPVLGHTRIIPEGLEPLYKKLRAAFDALPV